MRRQIHTYLAMIAVSATIGCTRSATDHPETIEVTGNVTFNGAAIAGAIVSFSPKAEDGYAAVGVTDNQGDFTLQTFETDDGAVPGDYAITVSKSVQESYQDEGSTAEDPGLAYLKLDELDMDPHGSGGSNHSGVSAEPVAQDLLPPKYKNRKTSGLETTVSSTGDNFVQLELLN
jgi:hypothetical protein